MISKKVAHNALTHALDCGAHFAEIFAEDREELNLQYKADDVQGVALARIYGAGIYVISGKKSAYVYLNDLREPALLRAVDTACELLCGTADKTFAAEFTQLCPTDPCPAVIYPSAVSHKEKIRLLQNAWSAAHDASSLIVSLGITYFDTDQRVLIANTEGVWAEDRRVTSRIRLLPTLSNGGETAGHFSDYTRPLGFEAFKDGGYIDHVRERISDIHSELFAEPAPSAFVPVVLEGGGCSGTFFHEACGHQLEASGMNDSSVFRHKLGQVIAGEKVTLIDDGTLPLQYGSSRFDDEGMPRQRNVLIENGVLKSFLADRLGAIRIGVPRSGSGRRQGYGYAPKSRMSNTYLAPGSDDPEEMIRSMAEGLYVTEIGGGTGGEEFTLLAQKAFWVKNGQIHHQVKGAMLLGRGDRTMLDIDRVGNTLVFEENGSFCGGKSGLVNTTTSGARMRVAGMIVGGKGGRA